MSVSDNERASGGAPLWIIVGVAMLAGGVGSAAVLSANQFLGEARVNVAPKVTTATILAGPDRMLPRGPVAADVFGSGRFPPAETGRTADIEVAALAPANPRFGDTRAIEIADPFKSVDSEAEAEQDDAPVELAALAEPPAKPTKAAKAAEKPVDKPAASKAPVTGRSVTNDDVNIRAGASSKSRVIGVVPANTSVDIVKCSSWCEISYGGKRGYVYSGFLGKGAKKAKSSAPALAKTTAPASGEVKSSVTLEPKRKWTLFKRQDKDTSEFDTSSSQPAFN